MNSKNSKPLSNPNARPGKPRMSLGLERDLKHELQMLANQRGISVAAALQEIVTQHLNQRLGAAA